MNVLRGWMARRSRGKRSPLPDRVYAVRRVTGGAAGFSATATQPEITQLVFSVLEGFSGPLGMILVEHRDRSREWVARDLDRAVVLETLMFLRDLWGRSVMDLALFSSAHALEVFLDRWGTVEIRTGSWNEPRIIAVLHASGFERVDRVAPVPPESGGELEWTDEATQRVRRVRKRLGLRPAPPPEDAAGSAER